MSKERIRYYKDFTEDFEKAPVQNMKLSEDYRYIREKRGEGFLSALIYALAVMFGFPFCKLHLGVKYKNRKAFRAVKKQGAFIYANHTQPVGDVFLPALACFPKRIYTVVSPANLSIPIIGKTLPYLGALPVADTLKAMKAFNTAIDRRIKEGKIVTVYPEAHVWEYCTQLRPFSDTSFKYPVRLGVPAFAMTVTYQKKRLGKKPKTTVYIDGPFYPDETLSIRERVQDLHQRIYSRMQIRSRRSTYDYIKYQKL